MTVNMRYIFSLLEENISPDLLEPENRRRQKRTNRAAVYSAASRRKFVLESSNWGASLETRKRRNYEIGAQRGPRRDKFRDAAGKYWGYDKDTPSSVGNSQRSVIFISKGSYVNREAGVPFSIWVSEPKYFTSDVSFVGERNPFFEVQQVVRLHANKRDFVDKRGRQRTDNWRTLIEGFEGENATGNRGIIDEHVEYDYLAFDMSMPFNYRQLDHLNISGQQYAKFEPEYNFYIKDYEEMIRFGDGLNQPEAVFPNLYALMIEKMSDVSNQVFVDHITLGGALNESEASIRPPSKNDNKFDIKKHAGQYFDIYGRRFSTADPSVRKRINTNAQKFKNMIVPYENVDMLREISKNKELFPMFVDMELSTDSTTEFAQLLADTQMTDDFMWSIVKDVANSSGYDEVKFVEVADSSYVDVQEDGTSVVKKKNWTTTTTRKVWNIFSWLKNGSLIDFDSGAIKPPDFTPAMEAAALKKSVFLDDGTLEENFVTDPKKKFFKSLLGVIFIGKLKTFLKTRFRTYDQLIEGQTTHSETVLYRIEKTLAGQDGSPTGGVLQNFWFPNTNQIDILKLVDTQVKYGKRYAYRVYAYQLAVNTKYSYSQTRVWDDGASFVVTQRPEILLVEQEIFLDNHMIMDDAPIPPEVEIVPYFADSRRLLFNLKSAVGEYYLDPISFNGDDEQQHIDARRVQKITSDGPIRFKSDDSAAAGGSFEIYRISEHPTSWADFDGQLLTAISNKRVSTGEYVDIISANKKYYYTFRMTDSHGHFSNPTDIYEVELVNDEGSIYMKKRIVEFAFKEPRHPSRTMRRLIQISPAYEQEWIDTESFDGYESALQIKNVKLGHMQKSPWGRKFKFRIISKKTGKKMDLNVDFKAIMDRRSTLK